MGNLKPVGEIDRRKYIGGSDVAAILGISPWRTPLDVFLDKTHGAEEITDPEKIRVLNRGKRMEPYVIDLLAEETGLEIIRRGERYIDREHGFIAAEIDAEARTGENVEIKTVSPFKANEWGWQQIDGIPLHYAAQAMHGLMVTGKSVCVFGVLVGGDDFRVYRIERDDLTIAAIRKKEIEFWRRVQENDPPAPSDVSDIYRLFGTSDSGKSIIATTEIEAEYLALKSLRQDAKELEEMIEQRERRIKLFMGDSSSLEMAGKPVVTWKEQVSRRLDQAAFKAERPELFEAFQKVSKSRVFRIK